MLLRVLLGVCASGCEATNTTTDMVEDDAGQTPDEDVQEKPGEDAGLLFHWEELDNGAGGWRENALRQLIGLRDGTPWEPVPVTQRVFSDVMTIGNNDGVGEPVE